MNSSFNAKIEALIAEITTAFDGVSREDGISLHEAAGLDDYEYSSEERAANRAKDTDAKWQEVPNEWIAQMGLGDVALNYFDPKGFRYYIPAYMIWMLKSWRDGGVANNTEHSIVFDLLARHDGSISEKDLARFSIFHAQQSKAIAHFLEFIAVQNPESIYGGFSRNARKAIDAYWCQFL